MNEEHQLDHKGFALWGLFFVSLIVLFYPTMKSLVGVWLNNEDYSHGFLVPLISMYIVYGKREELIPALSKGGPSWCLLLVFPLGVLYILAKFAGIMTMAPFFLILMIPAIVAYLFGFRVLRVLAFPLVFLFFMIPIPSQIYSYLTLPLQLFVSKAATILGSTIGIPILREGNILHLPYHTLQVVQACSGLRSMVSLLAISAVVSYMFLRSNSLRTVLFFSAIPISITVNVLRVLSMVVFFHYFNTDLTKGTAHTITGLLIFFGGLALLILFRGVLSIWDSHNPKES